MHIKPFYTLLLVLGSCTLPQDKKVDAVIHQDDTTTLQTTEQNNASADTNNNKTESDDDLSVPIRMAPRIREPKGIYQTVMPYEHGMEQTIAFYDNETFRLQEKYAGHKKDSVVITEGNWSLSDGSIWLYKDQVVRGRYSWKGDTLQYISPFFKKNFSMRTLQEAAGMEGGTTNGDLVLSGTGTEPLWNLSCNNKDTVSFSLANWEQPLQLHLLSAVHSRDSVAYTARNDSAELRITVYPQFCVDGQSDVVYRHKIRVAYNNQVYYGCGTLYR